MRLNGEASSLDRSGREATVDAQLNRRCLEVLHATTVKEFTRVNVEFVHAIGFRTVATTVITDHSPNLTEFQSVTNAPVAYLPAFEDMESAKLDPVSQHCKRHSSPIVWDQSLYVGEGRGDFWEHQAAYGYRSGISIAMHLPQGRHFMFGIDSDRQACATEKQLRDLIYDVQLFAAHAQAAAFDLCLPYPRGSTSERLAPRELDALRRSMDGLTDWEVGRAMGISETEAKLRVRRSMQKLGCSTKYEAALRAIRLGLIDCY